MESTPTNPAEEATMTCPMSTIANLRNGSTFKVRGRTFEVTSGCFTRGHGGGHEFVEVPVFNEGGKQTTVKVRETDRVEVIHSVTAGEVMRRNS